MSTDISEFALDRRAAPAAANASPSPVDRRWYDRTWPYVRGAALSIACIWTFVFAYLTLTPRTYVSRWTLNLPGSTSNVNVSLESIGQAQSSPSSPFSSSSLSPKVVYKEIADSEAVRANAAKFTGMSTAAFGKARVKLVDETALMLFEIAAPTPEIAKSKGEAMMKAFDIELERLRRDELEKRAAAIQRNLADFQHHARLARENIVRSQSETGLVSANQFAEFVTGLNLLKRRIVDLGGEVEKIADEHRQLASRLGVSAALAGEALALAGDVEVHKAVQEYADASTLFAADDERFGERHPQRLASSARRDAALQRLQDKVRKVAAKDAAADLDRLVSILNSSARSDLFASLVRTDALLGGKRRELEALHAERLNLEKEVTRLNPAVARLEELKKEQLVADAVLSSAIARLDSSKSDIFGSYPIVQVVAPPDSPDDPAQPRPLYAALGGISGSFFACLAWTLAWLQSYHRSKRRRSASSSG